MARMRTLKSPIGALFGIAFVALWVYATFCAVMMRRNSNARVARWLMMPPPPGSLTPEGRVWLKRYFWALGLGVVAFGLALALLPV